jgi:hypothetical protein
MKRETPFIEDQGRPVPWIVPLIVGMILGACITGLAWSHARIEQASAELAIPDFEPVATEAVMWAVDVDGDSAP